MYDRMLGVSQRDAKHGKLARSFMSESVGENVQITLLGHGHTLNS